MPIYRPQYGPSYGRPGGGSDPLAGVARDASSLIYFPETAEQWRTALVAAAIYGGDVDTPDHLYLCQEESGDLIDSIGGINLTAVNTAAYRQAVPGYSRLALQFADAGTARFNNTAHLTGNPYFVYMVSRFTGTPSVVRSALTLGGGTTAMIQVTSAGIWRVSNSGSIAASSSPVGTAVKPFTLLADSVNDITEGTDEAEVLAVPVHSDVNGSNLLVPSASTPPQQVLYMAVWTGAKASAFNRANRKAMLETLGWPVTWSP